MLNHYDGRDLAGRPSSTSLSASVPPVEEPMAMSRLKSISPATALAFFTIAVERDRTRAPFGGFHFVHDQGGNSSDILGARLLNISTAPDSRALSTSGPSSMLIELIITVECCASEEKSGVAPRVHLRQVMSSVFTSGR